MEIRNRYIDLLVHVVLQLHEGEALSINTSHAHLAFAGDLAQQASEKTRQAVHVVVIESGIPGDVLAYTPVMNDRLASKPTRAVLLRIDDTEELPRVLTKSPSEILSEVALLQQSGNLAPPQLNRPVAPWAVVSVPGPKWARYALGSSAGERELWNHFGRILGLERSDYRLIWEEHLSLLRQRSAYLNRIDPVMIRVRGKGTDLTIRPVSESRWRDGVHTLPDGRTFIPYLPAERVSLLVDRSSTRGTITASRAFSLLGNPVEGARLTFFEGKVVDFDAITGKDALETALSADDGASRLSELSLVDIRNPLAMFDRPFGYQGFDENQVSSITIGMGEASHLEALETYGDESELQHETGCNVSAIRVRIPVGRTDLEVSAVLEDTREIKIMANGAFIM